MLLSLLLKYKSLFDGTLGDWNSPPASIKLKDGAKLSWQAILQIHKATIMKELVGIGALKRQISSEWASPTFIIPKKTNQYVLSAIFGS
jgi:hypothetical protein